jgi:hypothetical protein
MPSQIITLKHTSSILKNNPLKDPYARDVIAYLPPSYSKSNKKFPAVYLIAGFTGFGKMNLNVRHIRKIFSRGLID